MDGAETKTTRNAVHVVAQAARTLHLALLDGARSRYELEHGPIEGPTALLQLLMGSPEFEWLRELSKVMADVDELLELTDLDDDDAAAVRAELDALLGPGSEHTPFGERYREALQADTDVVIAHGRLRNVLGALPIPSDAARAGSSERRRGWATRRAERRRT